MTIYLVQPKLGAAIYTNEYLLATEKYGPIYIIWNTRILEILA